MKHKAPQEPKPFRAFRDNYLAAMMMVAALLISSVVSAQLDSAKYSRINGYGFGYKRMVFDSVLMIPRSTSPHVPYRAGAIRYNNPDSTLQLWTGNQWMSIVTGVGNGVDTAYMVNDTTLVIETPDENFFLPVSKRHVDSIYRKPGQDSIFYTVAGIERAIKDSAGTNLTLTNTGTGYSLVTTPNGSIKRLFPGYGVLFDSTTTANSITARVDTSSENHVVTQSDLNDAIATAGAPPGTPDNAMQYRKSDGTFGGDSLQYFPSDNKILTSQDYIQYGREVTGFFQDSTSSSSHGVLWIAYPRGSGGSGADTLDAFFSEIATTKYDAGQPENPVLTIMQFGQPGTGKPRASIRFEQNYYDQIEYHALTSTPRLMSNPNDEVRHMSWTISRNTGSGVLHMRIPSIEFMNSDVTASTYGVPYGSIGYDGLRMNTYSGTIGSISVTNGLGPSSQMGIGMQIDTTGSGFGQFYVGSNVGTLQVGGDNTAITITNPATTGGEILLRKNTTVDGKQFNVSNVPNSSVGLGIIASTGYIFSVSSNGSGYANAGATGRFFVNRPLAQSTSVKLLDLYDGNDPNEQLFNVTGAGNMYAKGLVNIYTLKTTLTAPATEGTTKVLISDTNGLVSNTTLMLKGTTNWTPGVVSAGSSASTTLTVTGAAVGDPVTVCKLSGYSNGEIYDAFVSATNTVTIRVHNVSTGSANYSSAADYNVVVLKY